MTREAVMISQSTEGDRMRNLSLRLSTKVGNLMRPRERTNTMKEIDEDRTLVDIGDRMKLAAATAVTSLAIVTTPMPAAAQGFHMSGSMMMPPEVATGITTMMCTDEVAMKNSMLSREACDAFAAGDHKLAMQHMENKAADISAV